MQLDDPGNTATGLLPSNSSYRPTQGAIIHSERTEFNDALRARGIIPALPSEARSPSPDLAPPSSTSIIESADLSDDDDLLDLEDDVPNSVLEKYRQARLQEVQKQQRTRKFGSIIPIGREEYTREVTEASEKDLQSITEEEEDEEDDEVKGKGTGVVCFLWKDSVPESHLLGEHLAKLALAYPSTKFVSIRGDMCIANYPDKNIPTMLIYRRGQLIKQIIGLRPDVGLKGLQTSTVDVEAVLTIYDAVDPFLKMAPTIDTFQTDEFDSEDESRRKNGKTKKGMTSRGGEEEDDELDL